MTRLLTILLILNIAILGSEVISFSIPDSKEIVKDDISPFSDFLSQNQKNQQEQLNKIFELLQMIKNHPANKNFNHFDYKNLQQESQEKHLDEQYLSRDRRRLSVFKDVYQRCRIQKRKEKNLCLYLANLYQNLKGFHGL